MAHVAIDVVGDYALAHDTYDDVAHGSRGFVTGLAVLLAALLARRGLRICFEIAGANRARVTPQLLGRGSAGAFVLGVMVATSIIVPLMEWLDGGLAGVPVKELGDAFGGSLLLGLGTTLLCAVLVGSIVYAIARWLVAHRDSIAAVVETLLRRLAGTVRPVGADLRRGFCTPRRRRTAHALRLCKRGPPNVAGLKQHCIRLTIEGDPREIHLLARVASCARARADIPIFLARKRGSAASNAIAWPAGTAVTSSAR